MGPWFLDDRVEPGIRGEAQADRYLDELDEILKKCGADPQTGKRRDEVRPGCWSKLVRKHVVFYCFTDDEVLILRVLHRSMDPGKHFGA